MNDRFLNWGKLLFTRQTLHRDDFSPVTFDSQYHTTVNRLPIQQHRTRAALAGSAAIFCACQCQAFTQHVHERHVGRDDNLLEFTVNGDVYLVECHVYLLRIIIV